MAGAGAAELARHQLLLQIRIAMRFDGSEAGREGVAAETRIDIERSIHG